MGLEQVVNDVQQGGEARVKEILDAARAEADGLLQAARDKAQAYHDARTEQAEADAAQLTAQAAKSAEFEARKMVLTKEAELQEDLRGRVLDALVAMPETARESHVKALLKSARDVIPEGTVRVAAADRGYLNDQQNYDIGDDIDIPGGIIVESHDGATRLDMSYDALLADHWRTLLAGESALFG